MRMDQQSGVRYPLSETVDFVIVGSGAAGGIIAKELSTKGFSVVVMEQGPRISPARFLHDEFSVVFQNSIGNTGPVTWRETTAETAKAGNGQLIYARLVGGSSVHMTANFWRFRPIDFHEALETRTDRRDRVRRLAHHVRRAPALLHQRSTGKLASSVKPGFRECARVPAVSHCPRSGSSRPGVLFKGGGGRKLG